MMTLNHGFSGYVCARAAMPVVRRFSPLPEGAIAFAVFIGAMLPDADAISNVIAQGAYFSDGWYGHRHASHSILGTLLLALLAALPLARGVGRKQGLPWRRAYAALVPCFWCGGLLHIAGDLFTPRLAMPLFWPLPGAFGALSHIGWFSPFLFWLFVAVLLVDGSVRLAGDRLGLSTEDRPAVIWLLNSFAAATWLGYLFGSRYDSADQWSAYQHSLLPDFLITPFAAGVHAAWHWMVR
jgi:membrane-bound metal-dependent hydrolase YbcI (DUF457 family)